MKLLLSELDKRVDVTLDRSIKTDGVNGVMKFGDKNDYPQRIERIIMGSVTAKAAADIYAKFLAGSGFVNEEINNIVIGRDSRYKKITIRGLLIQAAMSMAYYNGCYIHTNLNLDRKVKNAQLLLFKNCRFSKLDERGYTSKIGYYSNWPKERGVKFKKEDIKWYDIFNLREKVFEKQVIGAGGIEDYKGQVYFHFLDNQYLYPLSPFDSAYMDADTENQLGYHKNNEVRNGFTKKHIFQVNEQLDSNLKGLLAKGIKTWMGSRSNPAMVIETATDENGNIAENKAIKVTTIDSNIDSKLYENWEKELSNKIRKAIKAIPAVLIDYDESKLGTTSGEGIIQATNFYNQMTKDDRNSISEMFKEVFSNSINEKLANNIDWTIKPISLYDTTNLQPATGN